MRKAEKRRIGAERAEVYLQESKERGLAAQKLGNKIRAEKQLRKAEDKKRKDAAKAIRKMREPKRNEFQPVDG